MDYEEEMPEGGGDADEEEQALASGMMEAMAAGDAMAFKDGLKEFIKTCMEQYGPGGGKGTDLALILGPPKKK